MDQLSIGVSLDKVSQWNSLFRQARRLPTVLVIGVGYTNLLSGSGNDTCPRHGFTVVDESLRPLTYSQSLSSARPVAGRANALCGHALRSAEDRVITYDLENTCTVESCNTLDVLLEVWEPPPISFRSTTAGKAIPSEVGR